MYSLSAGSDKAFTRAIYERVVRRYIGFFVRARLARESKRENHESSVYATRQDVFGIFEAKTGDESSRTAERKSAIDRAFSSRVVEIDAGTAFGEVEGRSGVVFSRERFLQEFEGRSGVCGEGVHDWWEVDGR